MKAIHSRAVERMQTGTASYGEQCVHHVCVPGHALICVRNTLCDVHDFMGNSV